MAETSTAPIAIPADDGTIADALHQLDAKLMAWVEAMAQVQLAVQAQGARQPEAAAGAPETAAVARPKQQADSGSGRGAAQAARSPSGAKTNQTKAATPPSKSESSPARSEPSPQGDEARRRGPSGAQGTVPATAAPGPVDEACDPTEIARQQAEQEERDLLAPLDPRIRMEIRIRRRLDNTKSVRELLDEVLAAMPPPEDEGKDRWWRKRGGKK